MYKLQLINEQSQRVLREHVYRRKHSIIKLINQCELTRGQQCYIIDDKQRTLSANYINHTVSAEDGYIVYKLFYNVELNKVQVPIRC